MLRPNSDFFLFILFLVGLGLIYVQFVLLYACIRQSLVNKELVAYLTCYYTFVG